MSDYNDYSSNYNYSSNSDYTPYTPPQNNFSQPPKPPRKKGGGRLVALALCCSLLGGLLGAGAVLLAREPEGETVDTGSISAMMQSARETSRLEIIQVEGQTEEMTAAEVYAANVQSTVGITTSITTNFWGFQTTSAASGSGFLITNDGYILTNYHVIEGSDSITVSLYDGSSYDAVLVGYDQSNDIAVLKIEAENLAPVVLGDSDTLNVGDGVVAIGNPLGELTFSLTSGVVSAKDRQVTFSGNVTMNLIQTDAAINSGNSGGALFNMYGEVVGVTNAKYSSSSSSEASIDNIGFAIPINSILDIVESIIEKGYISKPYLGVTVSDVSSEMQMYGLPQGASIQSVVEDSPASRGGLQKGDIVTKADGQEITCGNDLVEAVGNAAVGSEMTLTVYRQGQTLELQVTIEENVQSALANEETQPQEQNYQENYGFPWGYGGWR